MITAVRNCTWKTVWKCMYFRLLGSLQSKNQLKSAVTFSSDSFTSVENVSVSGCVCSACQQLLTAVKSKTALYRCIVPWLWETYCANNLPQSTGSAAPVLCRHPQLLTATVFFLFVIFCSCMNPLCSLGHHSPFICFSFEYMIPYIIYVNKWPNLYFGCDHDRQWWRRQTMESNFALKVKQILYLLKKK